MLGSSTAHCFSPMSADAHTILFMFDYLSISSYAFGADLALYYYERPVHHWFFNLRWLNIGIFFVVCMLPTMVSSLSRFSCRQYRYTLRGVVYTLPAIVGTTPLITRLLTCRGYECVPESYPYHIACYLLSFAALFFFTSKLPERLSAPGKFDYFGHSHQIFHICSSIGMTFQMISFITDSNARKTVLTAPPVEIMSDFSTTFGLFVLLNSFNVLFVAMMAVLITKGFLIDKSDTFLNLKKNC
jgi:adiponectin receptor